MSATHIPARTLPSESPHDVFTTSNYIRSQDIQGHPWPLRLASGTAITPSVEISTPSCMPRTSGTAKSFALLLTSFHTQTPMLGAISTPIELAKPELTQDPMFYSSISSGTDSIINADRSRHGPLRKQSSHGFCERALRMLRACFQEARRPAHRAIGRVCCFTEPHG